MRIKQSLVVCLVLVAMAGGFVARSHVNKFDAVYQVKQIQRPVRSVSAYAPGNVSTDVGRRSDVDLSPLQTFYEALLHLREEYVEPIQKDQERKLTYGALQYMLDSLHDPLTRFYEPRQAKLVTEAREGKFHGIGALLTIKVEKQDDIVEERVVVLSVLPGSPAEKAGLLPGDVISRVDGKPVLPYEPYKRIEKLINAAKNGLLSDEEWREKSKAEYERVKNGESFLKVMDMLSDDRSEEFTLTITRPGEPKTLEIKVGTAAVSVQPVEYRTVNPSVGYIRLNLISDESKAKLDEAITLFKDQGIKGIVLDLRDSPGGDIETLQVIAGRFIPGRTVSLLQLPHGKQRTLKAESASGRAWTGQTVVLVNGATSSAAEVLAAAIRDGAKAKLVGENTCGNSLQQTFMPLRDGSAISMTTGKYLTPKGVDYLAKGLKPDISAQPKRGQDSQLARAIEVLITGKDKG